MVYSAGIIFAVGSIIKGFKNIQKTKKSGEFINQSMVLMISLGDLLTSAYLLTLTSVHWIHGSGFCEYQFEWISGAPCTIIGVLNSTGSSISSLVMALVSCFRLRGTARALRYRRSKKVTLKLKKKLPPSHISAQKWWKQHAHRFMVIDADKGLGDIIIEGSKVLPYIRSCSLLGSQKLHNLLLWS